ncbi:hypothetical protein BC940DRAFT_330718 [Gongronella butleri]|nr:hypothetical protein BC940DRAFT_330718 [Gongronella butleri]
MKLSGSIVLALVALSQVTWAAPVQLQERHDSDDSVPYYYAPYPFVPQQMPPEPPKKQGTNVPWTVFLQCMKQTCPGANEGCFKKCLTYQKPPPNLADEP